MGRYECQERQSVHDFKDKSTMEEARASPRTRPIDELISRIGVGVDDDHSGEDDLEEDSEF